jgi:hypothetical protein
MKESSTSIFNYLDIFRITARQWFRPGRAGPRRSTAGG